MWRLAAAIVALKRATAESQALFSRSMHDRFMRQCERLDEQRHAIVRDSQANVIDHDAITQRVLCYYHDVGELQRAVEASVGL